MTVLETDGWGHMPRWTRDQAKELETAFWSWVNSHGLIWFETDARLAHALATALGLELTISE